MAITTIFPSLPTDIEEGILYYMEQCPRALVDLSGTHWFAYKTLGNGTRFKVIFNKQHPLLAKADWVFSQLKLHYPECCWKVACCTLLKGYTPFTMEFLERAIPSMTLCLNSERKAAIVKKQAAELELSRICGSYYQDPNSPIHQAWEALSTHQMEYLDLKERVSLHMVEHKEYLESLGPEVSDFIHQECSRLHEEILQLFRPISDDENHINRFNESCLFYSGNSPEEKSRSIALNLNEVFNEDFLALLSRDILEIQNHKYFKFLDFTLIEKYREVCIQVLRVKEKVIEVSRLNPEVPKLQQELTRVQELFSSSVQKYQELESKRSGFSSQLKKSSAVIVTIDRQLGDVRGLNRLRLLVDLYSAKNAEGFMCDLNQLQQIRGLFYGVESNGLHPEENTPAFYQGQLSRCRQVNLIWEMIYHQCANKVREDRWAEKHFYEFPQELEEILTGLQLSAVCFKVICSENLDLSLKHYVDRNVEALRGQLSSLREVQNGFMQRHAAGDPDEITHYHSAYELTGKIKEIDRFIGELSSLPPDLGAPNISNYEKKKIAFLSSLIAHIESHGEPSA